MICKTSLVAAALFVNKHHRHLKSPRGHKFSIAMIKENRTLGVVITGRPVNRNFDKSVIEFTRVCVFPGQKNICSQLLAAARKEAKRIGYKKAITYIRADENGSSLRADNWKEVAFCKGRQWHKRKPHEIIDKKRFEHLL